MSMTNYFSSPCLYTDELRATPIASVTCWDRNIVEAMEESNSTGGSSQRPCCRP